MIEGIPIHGLFIYMIYDIRYCNFIKKGVENENQSTK